MTGSPRKKQQTRTESGAGKQEFTLSPWPVFERDEVAAVTDVLESGRVNYWTGTVGRHFEEEFANHCEAKYAVALANGSLALELALEAAGIGADDEVVVTPRSFLASASCVVRLGGRPIFADVSLDSQNITPESVAAAITPRTKAIIAVHHAGWPCDMDGLMALARERNLTVIEDCAQAHGATYKGRPVGGLGHVAAFSFCQDKIMTTGGEGGMLVTNDEALWRRAWSIKDHGKSFDAVFHRQHPPGFRWLHDSFGSNFRMTEMQAAIGRIQLAKLQHWNQARNRNAEQLIEIFRKFSSVRVPVPSEEIRHAYYRLYAFVDPDRLAKGWDRDRIMREIVDRGIPCLSGSCPEIYNEKVFDASGLRPKSPLANARNLGSASLAFLVHPTLTSEDIDRTCDTIDNVMTLATLA